MTDRLPVHGYHAHLYFDAETLDQASALAERAGQALPVKVGRVHQKPVGPHPRWSCQLHFEPEALGQVLPWLAQHREGLTIFFHLLTGDELRDHTEGAFWMGEPVALNLAMFQR